MAPGILTAAQIDPFQILDLAHVRDRIGRHGCWSTNAEAVGQFARSIDERSRWQSRDWVHQLPFADGDRNGSADGHTSPADQAMPPTSSAGA